MTEAGKLFERCVSVKHVFHIFVSFMNFLSGRRLQKWGKNVLPNTWLQSSYLSVLENPDTGVGGAEVNADSGLLGHLAWVDLFVEKILRLLQGVVLAWLRGLEWVAGRRERPIDPRWNVLEPSNAPVRRPTAGKPESTRSSGAFIGFPSCKRLE